MDKLIQKFPVQLREAIEIGEMASIRQHNFPITKVVVCGMGGSSIGGAYVSDLIAEECTSPFFISSTYTLPAFVDRHTLVIFSSYSGNTEETIAALEAAPDTGAKIVCITSGGRMAEFAAERHLDIIELPTGWPSPRACLGFSIVEQLYVLFYLKLISYAIIDQIKTAIDLLMFEQEDIMGKGKKIAELLKGKFPVIYTAQRTGSVAVRWRQQLNENSKVLCWHNIIPEMNHNELVGWKDKQEGIAVVFLRYKDDLKKIQTRTDLTKQIVSQLAPTVIEIFSKGQSLAEKMMYMTHLGDWVSYYLADLRGVDASEIAVIDFLKGELKKSDL